MKRSLEPDVDNPTLSKPIIIKINAGGGPVLMTTLKTLQTFPQSMIARLFSRPEQIPRDEDGNYFIDSDPTLFRAVINVLRTPSLMEFVPDGINEDIWWHTLDYWGLKEVAKSLDECTQFAQNNHNHALDVYLSEYRIAKGIVKAFDFEIEGEYVDYEYSIVAYKQYINKDMSGEVFVKEEGIDVSDHLELTDYIYQHKKRFIKYFQNILPCHKITLGWRQEDGKKYLALGIEHVLDDIALKEVFSNDADK